jgi:YidC/Oxa1 family membrane protein insertase
MDLTAWETIIIQPFVNFLLWIYSVVGNLGVAIMLFTIASRVLLYPLTAKQIKSSQALQELQKDKKWIEIQEKYKGDKEKLGQEQMKFYQERKISPFASCLPTLVQFPIIIGLYQAMQKTVASSPIDLVKLLNYIYPSYSKAIGFIPLNTRFLWMDMGSPERLFVTGLSFGIPVLAVLVVITTYISTKIITPPPSGDKQDQAAMMSNMMNVYMPLLMGWFAYQYNSGLALYFVTSNLIQILQYAVTGRVYWKNLLPKKKVEETKKSTSKKTRG